jgi:hypothetical protein
VTVAFVSGSAGLTHQLLWTRRLVDLLGADAGTFARVIGAFFVGLALGAWFASRPAPPSTSFWKRIAWAEFGVAFLAVPVLVSAQFADWIWSRPAIGSWTPFFAPPLLVLPPAVFMGLVLPWILRALADHADANRTVRLYAANLMGGIAGIALVMWLGLPRLGRPRVGPRVSREGVATAVERGPDDRRILFNNTYALGGSRARFNQERQAHLPLPGSSGMLAATSLGSGGLGSSVFRSPNTCATCTGLEVYCCRNSSALRTMPVSSS